jgi:hypothetical protein
MLVLLENKSNELLQQNILSQVRAVLADRSAAVYVCEDVLRGR